VSGLARVDAASAAYDVESVRADFPILSEHIGDRPLTYLDNAASTQKPRSVLDAVTSYYEHDNANVHRGVHTLSERATIAFEGARAKVARFLGAKDAAEVVFVRGTTEALNLVASSHGGHVLREGDEVVLTAMEHHSNIVPWQMACARSGARLRVVPVTNAGELDLEAYAALLGPRTKIVAVTHVSNALGTVNPVAELATLAHAVGATVVIDGAQAVPHATCTDAHRRGLLRVFGPQALRADGHRCTLGPSRTARGDAALAGRRRDDPHSDL